MVREKVKSERFAMMGIFIAMKVNSKKVEL